MKKNFQNFSQGFCEEMDLRSKFSWSAKAKQSSTGRIPSSAYLSLCRVAVFKYLRLDKQ